MISKLVIRNFKKIREQEYLFTDFDLLVGQNNSGKSTVLQAMAIWQFCVDEFHRSQRKGSRGIQVVLPNFTALPVPEFNLLWTDRTDRRYPSQKGEKKQEYIYIEISVSWKDSTGFEREFGVLMRYQTPQSIYAIPKGGWKRFTELDEKSNLPRIVYVPPFSGIEPSEMWYDDGIVRRNVGKAQPGSVIRNLLFRVIDQNEAAAEIPSKNSLAAENSEWKEIRSKIREWFGVELQPPQYQKRVSTEIKVTYKAENNREFDIIAGGSGFHQIITLLAFIYGYSGVTTILFDEPDAHLHVNLQRIILNYLKTRTNVQFIIATHAEEFIKGVDNQTIISVLSATPRRIDSKPAVITALTEIENIVVVHACESPFILYVEGEDDERLLN